MAKKYDVVALGELLIDFTENAVSSQGNPLLEANPGGAPCNVLAMLNKLGKKTAFMGKVGRDQFGVMLKRYWMNWGSARKVFIWMRKCIPHLLLYIRQKTGTGILHFTETRVRI